MHPKAQRYVLDADDTGVPWSHAIFGELRAELQRTDNGACKEALACVDGLDHCHLALVGCAMRSALRLDSNEVDKRPCDFSRRHLADLLVD